jgi:predicted short-subunit dehydrogenase-like oxidoreductase (DUF2520 family)
MKITLIGAGRAGRSFALALADVGHDVRLAHHDDLGELETPELILLTVPDDAILQLSLRLPMREDVVVAHVAGSRGLEELAGHPRTAFLHPLVALPNPEVGAARLQGALFSVGGDALIDDVVTSLSGRALYVRDEDRVLYHAAAAVTANHLVALMGQVQVLAESIGLNLEDFLPLAQQALDDVVTLGVDLALTGPASRADMATIDAHLAAIPDSERAAYVAMANLAFEVAERRRLTAHA